MKIFFDTNVYVAEALLGRAADRLIRSTVSAKWRIYCSEYVLDEVQRVIVRLGFPARLAALSKARIRRRAKHVMPVRTRHVAHGDQNDSPILCAAVSCGADYLVTNDRHLLELHPYEGLEIVSMDRYIELLRQKELL